MLYEVSSQVGLFWDNCTRSSTKDDLTLPKFYALSRLVLSPHSLTHALGTILFACDPGRESRDSILYTTSLSGYR